MFFYDAARLFLSANKGPLCLKLNRTPKEESLMKSMMNILLGLAMLSLASCGGSNASNGEAEQQGYAPYSGGSSAAKEEAFDPMTDKGVGPVADVTLGDIDHGMVAEGKSIFEAKCSACHKIETKYIGPALKGVTERRTPEWIMNMILNPENMIQKDPIAKKLLGEIGAPMANQHLKQEEARKVLEYFRTQTGK